jgi:hypothetical protein
MKIFVRCADEWLPLFYSSSRVIEQKREKRNSIEEIKSKVLKVLMSHINNSFI